jgi:hypothetical protein
VPLRASEPSGEDVTSNNRKSTSAKAPGSSRLSSDREGENAGRAGDASETDSLLRRRDGMESYPTMEEKLMDAVKLKALLLPLLLPNTTTNYHFYKHFYHYYYHHDCYHHLQFLPPPP